MQKYNNATLSLPLKTEKSNDLYQKRMALQVTHYFSTLNKSPLEFLERSASWFVHKKFAKKQLFFSVLNQILLLKHPPREKILLEMYNNIYEYYSIIIYKVKSSLERTFWNVTLPDI